jgi:hypothetical protein
LSTQSQSQPIQGPLTAQSKPLLNSKSGPDRASLESSIKSSKKKLIEPEKKEADALTAQASNNLIAPLLPPMSQAPSAPESLPQGSYLSPQTHELFQTMVGLVMMKQLTSEGMQGTQMEISLNNPEYQNSLFYGLKIVITEYKTAPGSYNLELQGNGVQNARLSAESAKLISAFNDNRYNLPFTINRLDISLPKEEKEFLNLQVASEEQMLFYLEQRNNVPYVPLHLHIVTDAYIKEKFEDCGFAV